MIRLENWTISSNIDMTFCKILPSNLSGCYSCLGAIFKYKCITDFGTALAEVICEGGNIFASKCSINGSEQSTILPFDKSKIEENCRVVFSL